MSPPSSPSGSVLPWSWLGRVGYAAAREIQETHRERLLDGSADEHLYLLEHDPVITLGKSARREHVLVSDAELSRRGIELLRVSRGGDVTYHGPGQLMVYPVMRLPRGLVDFLASLAAALGEVAGELGVPDAAWRRDPAGLWLGEAKLAACGLHIRRRVTAHGFALDVATPPEAWRAIVPCGLSTARQVSLDAARRARGLSAAPPMAEVAPLAADAVARRFGRRPRRQK